MARSTFQYIFIPADSSVEVECRTGSTAGGLLDDELIKAAKQHFFHQSGGEENLQRLRQASPEEKIMLAKQFRENQRNNQYIENLDDDLIIKYLESQFSEPSCEIMALTVPTKGNNYNAVSMYVGGSSNQRNDKASKLLEACGHRLPETSGQKVPGIFGDVFVGRCYDNEGADDWHRTDFVLSDLDEKSDWIQISRIDGGGGGKSSGGSHAPSLNSILGEMQSPMTDDKDGISWSQTDDEVEISLSISSESSVNDLKVTFSRDSLVVKLLDEIIVDGFTGGMIALDDCTYTLQESKSHGRELTIILAKRDVGRTWAYALKKD
jgi:CS domain